MAHPHIPKLRRSPVAVADPCFQQLDGTEAQRLAGIIASDLRAIARPGEAAVQLSMQDELTLETRLEAVIRGADSLPRLGRNFRRWSRICAIATAGFAATSIVLTGLGATGILLAGATGLVATPLALAGAIVCWLQSRPENLGDFLEERHRRYRETLVEAVADARGICPDKADGGEMSLRERVEQAHNARRLWQPVRRRITSPAIAVPD